MVRVGPRDRTLGKSLKRSFSEGKVRNTGEDFNSRRKTRRHKVFPVLTTVHRESHYSVNCSFNKSNTLSRGKCQLCVGDRGGVNDTQVQKVEQSSWKGNRKQEVGTGGVRHR